MDRYMAQGPADVDQKLVQLELLALNFHDALNVSPLFWQLDRQITEAPPGERETQRQQLNRVARGVKDRQMALLAPEDMLSAQVVELGIEHPMLQLRLFTNRLFRIVNISASMVYAGFFGWIFVLPLYMQTLRGFSATQSGLVQAPQAVAIFVVSNLLGKRVYRVVGPRRLMVVGSAATALFTAGFGLADLDTPLWMLGTGAALRGAAVGLVFVSIQTAVYATVSNADTGRATSLFNTQRQIAFAFGVALAASVILA